MYGNLSFTWFFIIYTYVWFSGTKIIIFLQ